MTTQHRRKRGIMAGSIALTAGLLLAGGTPALAAETLEETDSEAGQLAWVDPRPGPIFGSASPETIEAAVEVTGWPETNIFAGETVTLTIHVDAELLGAPSVEGELVGLGYGSELLGFGQLDAEGTAQISVRPLQTGPLELTPFFLGDTDGHYVPVTGDSGTVTVDPVPVTVDFWFNQESESGVNGFGGSTLEANVIVEPFCVDYEDTAANDECYAIYGVPSGEFLIMRDGETIGSVNVPGTPADRLFADPSEDLSDGERAEFLFPGFTVPDILLGSPDSFEVVPAFDADNWFMTWVGAPTTVNVSANQPELLLMVGDDWDAGPADHVNADSVLLTAWFFPSLESDAPLEGTVTFFANGEAVSDPLTLEPDEGFVEYEWPLFSSGNFTVHAEFTPSTLNYTAAATDGHDVLVIVPPVPNPTPDDGADDADTDGSATDGSGDGSGADSDAAAGEKKPAKPEALAYTGGGSMSLLATASLVLLLAGGLAVVASNRRRTTES